VSRSCIKPKGDWAPMICISAFWQAIHVSATHVLVMYSWIVPGKVVGSPTKPASSISASHDAWMRLPVILPNCPLNFNMVCKCTITCSMYRFGMLSLPYCHGPWTMALGNDLTNLAEGRPCVSIGHIISTHCCFVKVVATRGYSNFWRIICCIPNSTVECVTFAVAIDCCHCLDVSTRCWNIDLKRVAKSELTKLWAMFGCCLIWLCQLCRSQLLVHCHYAS